MAFWFVSCKKTNESLKNTIYKFGFKTDSTSTGPLDNSAFIMKINDSLPALFLTAHHNVPGTGKWDEIDQTMKNGWAWSIHDSTYEFKIGQNLPIRNAETLKLDLAAFYLPFDTVPHLVPAEKNARVGDTVYLFSKMIYNKKTMLKNRGVVIYATDSVVVYELTDVGLNRNALTGTSGSCMLNNNSEVVANHYGGLTIPNEEVRKKMALDFPLLNKFKTRDGKTYGVGLPIELIKKSLIKAFIEK